MKHEIAPLMVRDTLGLTALDPGPFRCLSLYLEADARGEEVAATRGRAHALLHQARVELEQREGELEHDVRTAAREDLERCRAFVDTFRPQGACRSLALFSCAGRDWWQHTPLPRPLAARYQWDTRPLVLPAVRLLAEYPRTGVILLDRERTRYFVARLGEVEEIAEMREHVHKRVREGGWYGLEERRIERHIEDLVRRHLKRVAAEARKVFREWPMTWLLVGGNEEVFEDFRHCLHPSLRTRWAKELRVILDAPFE